MDVDDFKKVNDTYGHLFGDEVLSRLSETIRSVVDARGAVGRFGGDEFMIVLDGVSDEEMLRRILKTASKNLQWTYKDYVDSVPVTTSCGVAKFPDDGDSFEDLFKRQIRRFTLQRQRERTGLLSMMKQNMVALSRSGSLTILSESRRLQVRARRQMQCRK